MDEILGPQYFYIRLSFSGTIVLSFYFAILYIYKTVVVMYHINESSYKEIAQTLDIPEKTVETRLYRARRLLKEKLIKANMGGEIGWNVKKS
jgi:RNA polymerase sigma-70 factor (ECF subfamily)